MENVIRLCCDGMTDHDSVTDKVLRAVGHLKRGRDELNEAERLLEESRNPLMKSGGTFEAIKKVVTGRSSGINKIATLLLVGVISLGLTGSSTGKPVRQPQGDVMLSMHEGMIKDAKVWMVRKDVKRVVALANARDILDRVGAEYGYTKTVLKDLGFCYHALGDRQGLFIATEKAYRQDPMNPYVYTYRGIIKLEDGKKDEARKLFEKAITLGDTDALLLLRKCS